MAFERPPAFDCAICERHISNQWPGAKQKWPLAPVCFYCEDTNAARVEPAGSFRDRRLARQIGALANALGGEARRAHYTRYGNAAESNRKRVGRGTRGEGRG